MVKNATILYNHDDIEKFENKEKHLNLCPTNLKTFVKCHINWLLMTKKSIQMVKLNTFDFKLKVKLIIEEVNPLGTSLDSATNV